MFMCNRFKTFASSRVIKNVGVLLVGTVGGQIISLAVTPLLTRLYTPADFGFFSVFISLVTLVSTVAALRYDQAIVLPKTDTQGRLLTRLSLIFALIVAAVMTLIFAVFSKSLAQILQAPELENLFSLAGILVAANALISIWSYWATRKQAYWVIAFNRIFASALVAGLQIVMWVLGMPGVWGLVGAMILGQVLAALLMSWRCLDGVAGMSEPWSQSFEILGEYKKMPLVNGPTVLVDAIRLNGINLGIAAVFSASDLGSFSMAWRMIQAPLVLIAGAVSQVSYRELAVATPGTLGAKSYAIAKGLAGVGAIPFLLLAFASPWIFPLIFGSNWQDAGYIAQFLTPWLFLNLITSPLSSVFVIANRQGTAFIFSLVFMATPFLVLLSAYGQGWDIFFTCLLLSILMTLLLGVYLVLVYRVVRRYDAKI